MTDQMLLGAAGLAMLIFLFFTGVRLGQWLFVRSLESNSQDRKQNSKFEGSSGVRPGGVSYVMGDPIPVRPKSFRWFRRG